MDGTEHTEVVDAAAVERELDALEGAGARGYDSPACDCVRALLTRAEELGGGVGQHLVARAHSHVLGLRERFEADQKRVSACLEKLEAIQGPKEELHALLAHGELQRVARAVRRFSIQPATARVVRPQTKDAHGSKLPQRVFTRDVRAERRKRAVVYEDSVAALVASFALARATDVVPEDAGPYNPLRIASETLDGMRDVSPFYLTVQLNRLEELASLLALPELPRPAEEKVLPANKKKPKGAKGH